MGYNHVASGLLAGLVTVPFVPVESPSAQIGWVLGVGGASLLPDLDSQSATASRMWGPLTGALSAVVAAASGGHRRGTHDVLLGPAVAALLVGLASLNTWSLAAVLALLIGLMLRGLVLLGTGGFGSVGNFVASSAMSWWLAAQGAGELSLLLAAAVVVGMAVHIAGDALTSGGVPIPLVWLIRREARIGLGLFGADSWVEKAVVGPLLSLAVCWMLLSSLGISDGESAIQWVNRAGQWAAGFLP